MTLKEASYLLYSTDCTQDGSPFLLIGSKLVWVLGVGIPTQVPGKCVNGFGHVHLVRVVGLVEVVTRLQCSRLLPQRRLVG